MLLERIDHVGLAVEHLDEAVAHYERLYGAEVAHRETMERDGVDEALIAVGAGFIQLLEPIRDDSPVAKFLERNGGPGVHHVGYGVADVGAALLHVKTLGARVVDEVPRHGSRGCMVAFLHPKGAMGVLVELVEDPSPPSPAAGDDAP